MDPNGDPLTYQFEWTQNGAETTLTDAIVSNEWTIEGDNWTCTATASDGELVSEPANDTVQIGPPDYGDDITDESGVVYDASGCAYCRVFEAGISLPKHSIIGLEPVRSLGWFRGAAVPNGFPSTSERAMKRRSPIMG